jgi:prolyl-tRNA synthetase
MTHGDDQGLILPPRLAPIQVVIVPIFRDDAEKSQVMPVVDWIEKELKGNFRVKVDNRENLTPGFKFNDWEMRGVPLRIEIGPKDVQKGTVALSRRDRPGKAGKTFVEQDQLSSQIAELMNDIHNALFERALAFRDEHIHEAGDYETLKEVVKNGWALTWWCGSPEDEARVKDDTKATTRCIPIDQPGGSGKCAVCGRDANEKVYWARAY